MKRLKLIVLAIVVMAFLSGCSVNYDLYINEDFSVNEEIVSKEYTRKIEKITSLKGEEAVNYLYDMFRKNLENENFYYKEENNMVVATTTESYNSIKNFKKRFSSDLFSNIKITDNNNETTLMANQKQKLGNEGSKNLLYDEVTISIHLPFKVLENNADEIKNNTYIWKIKKDEDLKNIKLVYDNKTKINSFSISVKDKNINVHYGLIIGVVAVIIISSTIIIITINNKKNNSV